MQKQLNEEAFINKANCGKRMMQFVKDYKNVNGDFWEICNFYRLEQV